MTNDPKKQGEVRDEDLSEVAGGQAAKVSSDHELERKKADQYLEELAGEDSPTKSPEPKDPTSK